MSLDCDKIREGYFMLCEIGNMSATDFHNIPKGVDTIRESRRRAQLLSDVLCDAQKMKRHKIRWDYSLRKG